ncbi:hypothetical protein [Streptomyces otsuchiensis]|uniref:hypothetical protein n=1 Tax=Streptomyces otsuchiensis TaxID=2681388 RepID=UPI0010308D24|nr:hypothetical protein [Streptomyces otsuchiensis]
MNKRDKIDDIIDIVLPLPASAPEDADEPARAAQEAVKAEISSQREVFERYLRVADGAGAEPPHGDVLLNEIDRARTEMREAEDRMRMLIAYGREFITPQPYPLKALAAAAGMSISGTRSAYTSDETVSVAERTGRRPAPSRTATADTATESGRPGA